MNKEKIINCCVVFFSIEHKSAYLNSLKHKKSY